MAERKKEHPGIQPPENYYGETTGTRHEGGDEAGGTRAAAPGADREPEKHSHTIDPTERTPGSILDEIPDGDGPRSDAGTNPLPHEYWDAYPDQKPGKG